MVWHSLANLARIFFASGSSLSCACTLIRSGPQIVVDGPKVLRLFAVGIEQGGLYFAQNLKKAGRASLCQISASPHCSTNVRKKTPVIFKMNR